MATQKEFEAFNVVPQGPCQGCAAEWAFDGTNLSRAHQYGCPTQPAYTGVFQGTTEVVAPPVRVIPRTPKAPTKAAFDSDSVGK